MIANGTIYGVFPIGRSMLLVGITLTLLFTFIEPESSSGLNFFVRFAFWSLHIAASMIGITIASWIVRNVAAKSIPIFLALSITGILGTMIATPIFLTLEYIFPQPQPDDWWDDYALTGVIPALISEFVAVLPMVLVSWYAVNVPLLFYKTLLNNGLPPDDDGPNDTDPVDDESVWTIDALKEMLPDVIGEDIVAISSDMHYLNIHTALGKTLLFGSLKTYVEAFGDSGLQVHRSHWVIKKHVSNVYISGDKAYCLMSTGLKVPISRSKRKEVKAYYSHLTSRNRNIKEPGSADLNIRAVK